MPRFAEQRHLPYRVDQMYDLVADVGDYPNFLPWCQGMRIYNRKPGSFHADLIIGFKMFRERFTSHVQLKDNRIEVEYVKGPLKYLVNRWDFHSDGEGGCLVDFLVDFEFKNKLFEKMVGGLFTEAVHKMVNAFESRADELYGPAADRKILDQDA